MELNDYLLSYIGSTLPLIIYIICYNELNEKKVKLKFKNFIFVPIISVFGLLNTHFNYSYTKLLISAIILFINNKLSYREDNIKTFIKTLIIYFLTGLNEVIVSIPISFIQFNNIANFDNNIVLKIFFTLLVQLIVLLICMIKPTKKILLKITKSSSNKYMVTFYSLVSLLLVIFLAYKFIYSFDTKTYLLNILILGCYLLILLYAVYNQFKIKKANEKQDILLNFMTKYEKILEKNRINNHELLNNLLILKSIKNKNSKEFEAELDDLINEYEHSGNKTSDLHNLPSGIKGIFYYKINDMELSNIKVHIKISKLANKIFKRLSNKEYKTACNIISTLLDNVKDAAEVSKDKIVVIDCYIEEDELVIIIENSYNNKIDLAKINTKSYSTKGKNRGLGLYIVRNSIEKFDNFKLTQEVNDKTFISTFTIKVNKN